MATAKGQNYQSYETVNLQEERENEIKIENIKGSEKEAGTEAKKLKHKMSHRSQKDKKLKKEMDVSNVSKQKIETMVDK